MKKKMLLIASSVVMLFAVSGCFTSNADVASANLSKSADQFEILRRVIFYNGITDKYVLSIEGFCSLGNTDKAGELSVTCKIGNEYKKHFLGLSDNVTYFVEQLDPANVSADHYRVVLKPETIIPDIDVR
jgi:carbohydrate-binding DOMON domain-containing protein